MKTKAEKIHKIRFARVMLRRLLHDVRLQLDEKPSDELYRRRSSYRKRLSKLNEKLMKLKTEN